MSTAVMLNNNVGIPNNPVNVGVIPGAMVHHGTPPHPHPPPVHSSGGTITVTNVPFGGPPPQGAGVPVAIRQQHPHHPNHLHPPVPGPPPATSASNLPGASTAVVAATPSAMEVDNEEIDTTDLTVSELQILSDLDSRSFGFLKLNRPENAKKKALVAKAIRQIERLLQEAQEQKDSLMEGATGDEIYIENKTYCKLGHLHLLLEDYEKALSAYQKYFSLISSEYFTDSCFMYGLGIVYFHFNCYKWATDLFRTLLYTDASFSKTNEAHLRLGYIYKVKGDFQPSVKHFKAALSDQSSCSLTSFEIRFQIAHLYEINDKPKQAKVLYEQLLKEKDLSPQLRADVHRQLGWMYHTVDALGEKQQREPIAVHFLQKSLETEPKSGQSLYLLGRCFASNGRVHDAFLAYRNSVDKSEGNADTWCSIGVLYQQQNQPLDALQAYICAVQLDKFHVSAWTNLGILYESVSQPKDALDCYVNACRGYYSQKNKKPLNQSLTDRVKFLQAKLANAPPQSLSAKPRQLPVIEEAWNLPISAEMTARQQQQQQAQRQAMYAQQQKSGTAPANPQYAGGSAQNGVSAAKRFKSDEPVQNAARASAPPAGLTPQQLQALQGLQQAQAQGQQLTAQQEQYLGHLQQIQRSSQQYQQTQQPRSAVTSFPNSSSPRPASSPCAVQSAHPESQAQGFNYSGSTNITSANQPQDSSERTVSRTNEGSSPLSLNDNDLLAWKDIGDDYIKNVDLDVDFDLMDDEEFNGANNHFHSINNNNVVDQKTGANRALRSSTDSDQRISIPSKPISSPTDSETFNISMTAKQLQERCKGLGIKGVTNASILGEKAPPPVPPEPPRMKLVEEQLYPQAPNVFIENKKDAFSPQLQEFCLQHPIAVVRGIGTALKLDLGLFSTKTLVETNPDHAVEVRTQYLQSADENHDQTGKKGWACYSHRAQTTVAKYASYQASSFQDSVKEENEKGQGPLKDSDSDSKDSSGNPKRKKKMIRFGTNVDLSDEKKWKDQLQELQKLPAFARVISAGNMLSHVGHVILGMNTVQLYMKVPGSRTPGHQENNNFCSININIGPGDCEWFGVPDDYWGAIQNLCEQNGINYLHGSWWPDLKDCAKAGIPVYRFTQKPGDLVWVNSGCVHWVQAIGWCNNIAWNVGPLTARQYQLGIERYEWNKFQNFKSIVPMVHLSWNLARNIRVADPKLFNLIKATLMRTLVQCFKLLEFARHNKAEIKFHGRSKNDASHYCGICEVEVFNILFIKEQERIHVVYCVDCARKNSPNLNGFMCLEEYKLSELMNVYDSFVLHKIPPPPPPPVVASVAPSIQPDVTMSSPASNPVASTGL